MSRRYEYAMQKHGKGQRIKQNGKLPINKVDFQRVPLFKDHQESEYEASWRKDLFSPQDKEKDTMKVAKSEIGLPLTVHAVGIGKQKSNDYFGEEFSGITDRISKVNRISKIK